MLNRILINCTVLCLMTVGLSAQSTSIELKTEMADGQFHFGDRTGDNTYESRTGYDEFSMDVSLALTAPVHKNIYLKTVIGTNNFTAQTQLFYPHEKELFGNLSLQQFFIEVLPEIRLFENRWLFINAGGGIHQISRAYFTGGVEGPLGIEGSYYQTDRYGGDIPRYQYTLDRDEFPRFSGYMYHFAANIGCHFTYNNIGIIGSFGYRQSGFSTNNRNRVLDNPPGVGFKQFTYKLGLSYDINNAVGDGDGK